MFGLTLFTKMHFSLKIFFAWLIFSGLFLSSASAQVEIELYKQSDPKVPVAGEIFKYVFTITNNGPDTAENVLFTDTLPPDFTYLASTDFCTLISSDPDSIECRPAGNAFTSPPYQLPAGESVEFEVSVLIAPGVLGDVTNLGSVSVDNAQSTITSFGDTAHVRSVSDLTIKKVSANSSARAGEQLDYQIIVENNGPSTAWHPVIRDTIGVQGTGDQNQWTRVNGCSLSIQDCGGSIEEFDCNFVLSTGVINLATLGAEQLHPTGFYDCDGDMPGDMDYAPTLNGRIIATINLVATEDGTLNNRAEVLTSDNISSDPNPDNNVAMTMTEVSATSDLQIEKVITSAPQEPWIAGNTQVTYNITVTNLGPSIAENVVVKDLLPKGVTVLSAEVVGDTGDCTLGTPGDPSDPIVCNLGVLTPANHPTYFDQPIAKVIAVTISLDTDYPIDPQSCTALLHNNAWVTSDSLDLDNTNNLVSTTSQVQGSFSDLKVTKFTTSEKGQAGDPLTYMVVVQNLGPCPARNVRLLDSANADGNFQVTTFQSDRPEDCVPVVPLNTDIQSFSTVCTLLEELEPTPNAPGFGAWTHTIEINTSDDITVTNDATVTHGGHDPNVKNDEVITSGSLSAIADVSVIKQAEAEIDSTPGYDSDWLSTAPVPHEVHAGRHIRYTLSVQNNGPSTANNVVLIDRLPDGLTFTTAPVSTPPGFNCAVAEIDNQITCGLGNMASGDQIDISFEMKVSIKLNPKTILSNEALVTSDTIDANNQNNFSGSLTSTIGGGKTSGGGQDSRNSGRSGGGGDSVSIVPVPQFLPQASIAPEILAKLSDDDDDKKDSSANEAPNSDISLQNLEENDEEKSFFGCSNKNPNKNNFSWLILLSIGALFIRSRKKRI